MISNNNNVIETKKKLNSIRFVESCIVFCCHEFDVEFNEVRVSDGRVTCAFADKSILRGTLQRKGVKKKNLGKINKIK